jgi:phosphate transport system substrate-binding protein
VKLTPHARLAAVAIAGALALTACGSDDNSGSTPGASEGGDTAACASGTLNGEGSSAQKNAIDEAVASFGEKCADATVNYNPTGSGAGIKQFNAAQVEFAGSDSALKTEPKDGVIEADQAEQRCAGSPAWNLPLVAGPIALAYNLPGVGGGADGDGITLTPAVTAEIFLGRITSWNDPAIQAINSGAQLPATPIKVFYRSDESGTTENFTKYLQAAAPSAWTEEPAKSWPGEAGEGREKSAGVAEGVKSTVGGITYVEWSYARDNDLGVADVDNGGGAVELTGESAGKALTAATTAGEGNDLRLDLDYTTKEAGVYPIVLVTYEIVCSKGLDAGKTALVKAFLTHLAGPDVQSGLEEIGYAPVPEEVLTKVRAAVEAIA